MIDTVSRICDAAEEIVDELTSATGTIVTKATPLLAPMASGATVLFSVYDGVGRMIDGMIQYPYAVSFAVGFVLAMAIEGINFASQHARDRAERLKATKGATIDYVNAGSLVTQSFVLTLAVILFLESIPGAVAWWNKELGTSDMTFRFGLLVLPFFSRIGARIFSVSSILDAIEGSQESRRAKRLQAKREALQFDLEMDALRKKAALDVATMEAAAQRKIEGRGSYRSKSLPEIARPVTQSLDQKLNSESGQFVETEQKLSSESDKKLSSEPEKKLNPIDAMNEARSRKIDQRRNTLLDIIREKPLGVPDLANHLGVSENTIRKDLAALQSAGHSMSVNGVVKLEA